MKPTDLADKLRGQPAFEKAVESEIAAADAQTLARKKRKSIARERTVLTIYEARPAEPNPKLGGPVRFALLEDVWIAPEAAGTPVPEERGSSQRGAGSTQSSGRKSREQHLEEQVALRDARIEVTWHIQLWEDE